MPFRYPRTTVCPCAARAVVFLPDVAYGVRLVATALLGINVFIASPGGLTEERKAFHEVIQQVNRDTAHDAGLTFIARGWEYTSAGIGRPQELINEHVRQSDYLLVILWDRWGRPTGGTNNYTSGTEEEFRVARECLNDAGQPMRDIVVLFKGVDARQLSDPGPELQKVLSFKAELEESRELLYSTFDTLDEFKDDFRSHLHQWVRDWTGGAPPPKRPIDPGASPDGSKQSPQKPSQPKRTRNVDDYGSASEASLTDRGKEAYRRGRYTEAEQLFVSAISGGYDRVALTEYVRFLRKSGRVSAAQAAAFDLVEYARDVGDRVGEIEGLANLGILKRQQGENQSSLAYLEQALRAAREVADDPSYDYDTRSDATATQAFLLDNLSLTLRRLPERSDEALAALDEARHIQEEVGDHRGAGFTWKNLGSLLYRLGRLEDAETALNNALNTFQQVDYANGVAATLGSLAEVYEARGDYAGALDALNRSIAVSAERNPNRIAVNYGALARIHLKLGDVGGAREFATRCSRLGQELGTPESLATGLHSEAQVDIAARDFDIARSKLSEALDLFRGVSNWVGVAAVLLDKARVEINEEDPESARDSLDAAEDALATSPHFGLLQEARQLEDRLSGTN